MALEDMLIRQSIGGDKQGDESFCISREKLPVEGHRLDGLGCLPGVLEVNPQVGALQHKFQKVVQHLIIDQVNETVQFQ